jgi:ankyrin repeat protein
MNIDDYVFLSSSSSCLDQDFLIINVEETFKIAWNTLGKLTIGMYERNFVSLADADNDPGVQTYFRGINFKPHFRYRSKKANWFQRKGVSHLELAAFSGNFAVFKAILEYGGYPPVENFEQAYHNSSYFDSAHLMNAVYISVCVGNVCVIDFLRRKGLDINRALRDISPVILACRYRHFHLVEYLLRCGHRLDTAPNCLHEVLFPHPNLEIAQLLIDAGADVNERGSTILRGSCPIHLSVGTSDESRNAMQFLLDRGASINAQNDVGETPLHLAISLDYPVEAIEKTTLMLLSNGADCTLKTTSGKTAHTICQQRSMVALADILANEESLKENNYGFKRCRNDNDSLA